MGNRSAVRWRNTLIAMGLAAAVAYPLVRARRAEAPSAPATHGRDVAAGEASKAAQRSGYKTQGLCGGYPRLAHLKTPPGFCVGQVASGFKMPRGVLEFDGKNYPEQFLVTDMGSWERNTGILWLVRPSRTGGDQMETIKLLEKLDLPHSVILGPEPLGQKRAWVATATQVLRVNVTGLDTAEPKATFEVIVDKLPGLAPKGQNYRHPLKTIVFDKKKELWVNVGSHSNNCEAENVAANMAGKPPVLCQEADGANPNGVIQRFVLDWKAPAPKVLSTSVVARGLRNSVALTSFNGARGEPLIIQAENSRDAINKLDPSLDDNTFPHEEINVIRPGKHYGWPYCYDMGLVSPEFKKYRTRSDCPNRERPAILLPPHSAPLGLTYYRRSLFPRWWRNKLLVALHGYRSTGHRILAFDTHEDGVPYGDSYDVITGWEAGEYGPMGAPVQMNLAADGSVYVVEDKNRVLLKLTYDPAEGDGMPAVSANLDAAMKTDGEATEDIAERCNALNQKTNRWARIQRTVIDVSCINCHRSGDLKFKMCDDVGSARMLVGKDGGKQFVIPHDAASSSFYTRMISTSSPMPPYPNAEEKSHLVKAVVDIKNWIDAGAKEND